MACLTDLTSLDLHGCKLHSLPPSLPLSLRFLNVSGNRLSGLPERLGCLHNLVHLDISENQLHTLPCMLQLSGLTRLHMGSNWQLHERCFHTCMPALFPRLVALDASGIGLKVGVDA